MSFMFIFIFMFLVGFKYFSTLRHGHDRLKWDEVQDSLQIQQHKTYYKYR